MQKRIDIYVSRIEKNTKVTNNSDNLLNKLNKLITDKLKSKSATNNIKSIELNSFIDNYNKKSNLISESNQLINSKMRSNSELSITTHSLQQLTDNDYRDILEALDKEFHQDLYALGIKTVSKYSLFGNERATEKIFALQSYYYKKIFSYNSTDFPSKLNYLKDALDFYQTVTTLKDLFVIKSTKNKTFSNIRNFLINDLNNISKDNLNILLNDNNLEHNDKLQIINLVLDIRSALQYRVIKGNNFIDLKEFIENYFEHYFENYFEHLDKVTVLNEKIYKYLSSQDEINYDDCINKNSIQFVYQYEKKSPGYLLNSIIKYYIARSFNKKINKLDKLDTILKIISDDNSKIEFLALKFLLSPDQLDLAQKKQAIVFILNFFKNYKDNLLYNNDSYKLINLLPQGINDIAKLENYINKIQVSDQLLKEIELLEFRIKDYKVSYQECEIIEKFEIELSNDIKELESKIKVVVDRKIANANNNTIKTESLILKEDEINVNTEIIDLKRVYFFEKLDTILANFANKEEISILKYNKDKYIIILNKINQKIEISNTHITENQLLLRTLFINFDLNQIKDLIDILKKLKFIDN